MVCSRYVTSQLCHYYECVFWKIPLLNENVYADVLVDGGIVLVPEFPLISYCIIVLWCRCEISKFSVITNFFGKIPYQVNENLLYRICNGRIV